MATSLNGTTPAATYESLLKLGDNSALSATLKRISDGAGNDTPIEISTAAVQFGGSTGMYWDNTNRRLGIGTNAPGVPLHITTTASESLIRLVRQGVTTEVSSGASGNAFIGTVSSAPFSFITNNSTRAQISATGEFGIGAVNLTSARLQVRGSGATSATTAFRVENSVGITSLAITDDGASVFNSDTTSTPLIARASNAICAFEMQNTGPTRRLRILASSTLTTFESTNTNGFATNSALNVGGSTSNNASAILQADSTTRGFLPPRMTTTQKNAIATPAAGLVVYDTTTNKLCCYDGTIWNDLF